jgi:uncharacterized protein (DUF362 family)
MAKGVSIKFRSYSETIPRLLEVINLPKELKKHSKIVIKPFLSNDESRLSANTPAEFVEEVLKFCLKHKNPVTEVFIAEGADGCDTAEIFEERGYTKLAEKYAVGLIDLNKADIEKETPSGTLKFAEIMYPKILKESFIISLPRLSKDNEFMMSASLSNMLGAFPSSRYKGFFSKTKSRIRKWSIKYSIHDILKCKMPDFALIDASDKGIILSGMPLDADKQAAALLGIDWKSIGYLRIINENFKEEEKKEPLLIQSAVN